MTQPMRVDRRVRRTQQALKDAFVALVLEQGYERVTVDGIANRADVARATFYAHYPDKEHLLRTLFTEVTEQLAFDRSEVTGAPPAIRTYIVRDLYEHAESMRDIYRVCLGGAGDGAAHRSYVETIAAAAERVFTERLRAAGVEPPIPVATLAVAFAGAHTALLRRWLEDDERCPPAEAAEEHQRLLTYGFGWALGMLPPEAEALMPEI